MKHIKSEPRYDEDLGMEYRHTEGEYNGHFVEVHTDYPGTDRQRHHVRFDRDNMKIKGNLDDGGLVGVIARVLGLR